jgi:hypothetical protein
LLAGELLFWHGLLCLTGSRPAAVARHKSLCTLVIFQFLTCCWHVLLCVTVAKTCMNSVEQPKQDTPCPPKTNTATTTHPSLCTCYECLDCVPQLLVQLQPVIHNDYCVEGLTRSINLQQR